MNLRDLRERMMKPRHDLSTKLLNEVLTKAPDIIKKHKDLYSKYDDSSSFQVRLAKTFEDTIIDSSSIEYHFNNEVSWFIEIDSTFEEYYNWVPGDYEYSFNTNTVAFMLQHENFMYAEYNFNTEKFLIEDTNQEFDVNCIDSLREMIFALQLEYSDIIETEVLWSMLSPMIEFKKSLPSDAEIGIIYRPNKHEFLELNPEIPKP